MTTGHLLLQYILGYFSYGERRHGFGEWSYILVLTQRENGLSRMKACKRGLERAFNHGQQVLDEQERDICLAAIGNTCLDKHDCDILPI